MATFELVGRKLNEIEGTGVRRYAISDIDTASVAYAAGWAYAPAIWNGLYRKNADLEEVGNGEWTLIVRYGTQSSEEGDPPTWSFDISTQSFRITQALEHIADYPAGSAPDHKGAIGVRSDGNGLRPEGTDVQIPYFTWEETHYVAASLITPAYLRTLETLVGSTNETSFRIWTARELLMMGVSGQSRAEKPVGLTFRFAAARTLTGLTFGSITGVDKKGHEYLWFEYGNDADNDNFVAPPIAVHVERIYPDGDYAALGLADPWNP